MTCKTVLALAHNHCDASLQPRRDGRQTGSPGRAPDSLGCPSTSPGSSGTDGRESCPRKPGRACRSDTSISTCNNDLMLTPEGLETCVADCLLHHHGLSLSRLTGCCCCSMTSGEYVPSLSTCSLNCLSCSFSKFAKLHSRMQFLQCDCLR